MRCKKANIYLGKFLLMFLLSRRRLLAVLPLLGVALLLTACLLGSLQPASMTLIDDAEANWLAAPTANYQMTVEIDRPGDRRRSLVTVVDHEIVEGTVSYYDFRARQWRTPYALNQEQAFPFTIPGLFDMIRGALEQSGREEIRVQMAGEPPFPRKIVFGPVIVDGEAFDQTRATVTVRRFLPQ